MRAVPQTGEIAVHVVVAVQICEGHCRKQGERYSSIKQSPTFSSSQGVNE